MSLKEHLRRGLWEMLLCVAASTALGIYIAEGFYVPDELLGRLYPVLPVCAAITFLLYLASYNRKSVVIGVCVAAAALVACVIILQNSGESSGAYGLFYVLISAVTAAVMLLSRLKWSAALVFIFGSIIIAVCVFLQYGDHPVCFFVFLTSSGALFILRSYRKNLLRVSAFRANFGAYAAIAAAVCLLAAALSLGTYFLAVRPLNPPTRDIKLITEFKKLPILEKLGVAAHIYLLDPNKTSMNTNNNEMISGTEGQDRRDSLPGPDNNSPEGVSSLQRMQELWSDLGTKNAADAISYITTDYTLLYVLCGMVLIVIGAVFGKLLQRKLRLRRIIGGTGKKQVLILYHYFLKGMRLSGLPPVGPDAPMEYCGRLQHKSGRFFPVKDGFLQLTETFERVCYGGEEPDALERDLFRASYTQFPAACRKSVGAFRYITLFFRI